MISLPSFEQFNESIKVTDINEGVFYRLPKNIISDELYLATKNLANFYQNTSAGRDIDPGVIDTIVRGLDKIKKAVKKFNSKEEVLGTVYEAEKMVYDELGAELETLKEKVLDLMKNTTDSKWKTALGSISSALSVLDLKISQSDSKLGVIPMKESDDVNEDILNDPNAKRWETKFILNYDELPANLDLKTKSLDKLLQGIPYQHEAMPQISDDGNLLFKTQQDLDKAKQRLSGVKESDDVNEASVQVAGKSKPAGAQVLATVIIDHLIKNGYMKAGADKFKTELVSDVKDVIMDSTF